MHIFLARNNVQAGPYTLEQFNQMLATGQVLLTDLMWHQGMDNWNTVNAMTDGQFFYRPTIDESLPVDTHQREQPASDEADYIINNTPTPSEDAENVWDRYSANNPHKSPNPTKVTLTKKLGSNQDIAHAKKQLDLASIGSRIAAKLVDTLLMVLASSPLFIALYNSPNFDKLLKWAEAGQTRLTSAQQMELMSALPEHILLLTNILVWGLMIAQVLLLMRRGQTIGKMIMGIRILDRKSNAIPGFFNLIIMRGLFTTLAYSLSIFGLVVLVIDLVMMLTSKERLSLHDKIAKTYVVRADDTQTTPLALKPD
ncbi:RDD family protein [Moraxella osloensis]|uniref:RDD family protein n=1 Tax=Faucicola osloensis TaxID=34062 RepID=UPI00242EBE9F|nr:RDD family protein [Moraxella osloensis]